MWRLLFFLNVALTGSAVPGNSREALLKRAIDHWCNEHNFGVIFGVHGYHNCENTSLLKENAEIQQFRLNGTLLRVGLIPKKEGYKYDCGGFVNWEGVQVKESYSSYILNLFEDILQFKADYVITSTWGTFDRSKRNWTGLVGLAKDRRIDLGICHSTITHDRDNQVDFLLSTLSSSRSFVYDPTRLPLLKDVFVLTFTPTLWLCFFVSILLLILCFRFSTWLHSRLRPDHEPWSWVEVVMWANAAICQQSYSRHPKGISCRTTFFIGYVITYLLYTGFAAGVTSLLAVEGKDAHLEFKDVITMKLKLVIQADGTQYEFLKNSPDPYARSLYHSHYQQLRRNRAATLKELFRKLHHRDFIGLGSTITLKNYLKVSFSDEESKKFTMTEIPNSIHQKAFILPKKSPLKKVFNYWIMRLGESGILNVGWKRYVTGKEKLCCLEPGWSSAGVGNLPSALIIMVGGWISSVVILFAEIAWMKKSKGFKWEFFSRGQIYDQMMRSKIQ